MYKNIFVIFWNGSWITAINRNDNWQAYHHIKNLERRWRTEWDEKIHKIQYFMQKPKTVKIRVSIRVFHQKLKLPTHAYIETVNELLYHHINSTTRSRAFNRSVRRHKKEKNTTHIIMYRTRWKHNHREMTLISLHILFDGH